MLQLTHMETIGVRELQQHASAALRRVERGETLGITERGKLVAILSAPSTATGLAGLLAEGRLLPARRKPSDLPFPKKSSTTLTIAEVLDAAREERL